jgi:multicomponent Na+:H+ antiporter subunit G
MRDVLTVIFAAVGACFFIGGTVGLLRCPDLYSRLHPATKCDTVGAISIIVAMAIQIGLDMAVLKLLVVISLLLLTSAPSGHAIGRSAFKNGVVPWHEEGVKPWPIEGVDE